MDTKSRRPHPLLVVSATAASAALFYFGTGLAPVAALTWLAPLPVLWLALRTGPACAIVTSFTAYLIGSTNQWPWYFDSVDLPFWPLGLAISLGIATVFACGVALFRALVRRERRLLATLALPALWTTAMYLILLLNPMGLVDPVGTPQADYPLVLQQTSITGAWSVAFLVLLVPAAVAAITGPGATTRSRIPAAAVTAIALLFTGVYGAAMLARDNGPTREIALVVHNTARWGIDPASREGEELLEAYRQRVAELPEDTEDVVLPEGTFTGNRQELRPVAETMTELAAARDVNIVLGMVVTEGGEKLQTAWTFNGSGAGGQTYQKFHDRVGPPGDALVFPMQDDPRVAIQICGDLAFDEPSRSYGREAAGIVLSPAATEHVNGWLLSRTGVLRGVENGYSVAWSARNGTLSLSDSRGRVLAEDATTGSAEFTVVEAAVPTGEGGTWYARAGNWFAWACAALTAVAIALAGKRAGRVR